MIFKPDNELYDKMVRVYNDTYKRNPVPSNWDRDPCDFCEQREDHHHAGCDAKNYCHSCYLKLKPVTQLYPGDMGYAPYFGPLLRTSPVVDSKKD